MQDFTLTQMKVINAPANSIGNRLLATFDLQLPVLKVVGCVMIKRADGSISVDGPRGKSHAGTKIETGFVQGDFRDALTERAVMLYEGFTGESIA